MSNMSSAKLPARRLCPTNKVTAAVKSRAPLRLGRGTLPFLERYHVVPYLKLYLVESVHRASSSAKKTVGAKHFTEAVFMLQPHMAIPIVNA